MRDFFEGKKILVTGHSGFKGSWLSRALVLMGSKVSGISLEPDTKPNLFSILNLSKDMNSYFADIRDYEKIREILKKETPEIVIHMAAQPLVRESYDNPRYTYETNVMGTVNILDAIRESSGIKAAVMITTDKVYEGKDRPRAYTEEDELGGHDPYSSSKACAEIAIRSYVRSFFGPMKKETNVASARAGNVLGGGDWSKDRIFPDIVRAVFDRAEPVVLRNPGSVRPWQHVLDPLNGYLHLAKGLYEGKAGIVGAWNFGPEESSCISVEELVRKAIGKAGRGNYEIRPDGAKHEMATLKLNASKAKKTLGWKPLMNIDDTIDWTMEWYKTYYSKGNVVEMTDKQIRTFFKIGGNWK